MNEMDEGAVEGRAQTASGDSEDGAPFAFTGGRFAVLAELPGNAATAVAVREWVRAYHRPPRNQAPLRLLGGAGDGDTPMGEDPPTPGPSRSACGGGSASSSGAAGASVRPGPASSRTGPKTGTTRRDAPRPGRTEPGRPGPDPSAATTIVVELGDDGDDEESCSIASSSSRKRAVARVAASSEEEEEKVAGAGNPKRRRGRPAKNPSNEGQFTAERLMEKERAKVAASLEAAEAFALDPDTRASSARNARRLREAEDLAEVFENEPSEAVAAAAIEAADSLAKGVEKSLNIKGGIKRSLWEAITSLTASTSVLARRAGASRGSGNTPCGEEASEAVRINRLRKEASHLREEKRRLEEEVAALEERRSRARAEVAENPPPTARSVNYASDGTLGSGGMDFEELSEPAPLPQRVPRAPGARTSPSAPGVGSTHPPNNWGESEEEDVPPLPASGRPSGADGLGYARRGSGSSSPPGGFPPLRGRPRRRGRRRRMGTTSSKG